MKRPQMSQCTCMSALLLQVFIKLIIFLSDRCVVDLVVCRCIRQRSFCLCFAFSSIFWCVSGGMYTFLPLFLVIVIYQLLQYGKSTVPYIDFFTKYFLKHLTKLYMVKGTIAQLVKGTSNCQRKDTNLLL
jgi:hypothetical protein